MNTTNILIANLIKCNKRIRGKRDKISEKGKTINKIKHKKNSLFKGKYLSNIIFFSSTLNRVYITIKA